MTDILPHRRSVRLWQYDYSQEGLYFITICCEDKICRFGEVENGEMILNDTGKVAAEEWRRTAQLRGNIVLHEFIIMPNHMHGVLEIANVGANCIRPQTESGVCDTPLQDGQNQLRSPSNTLGAIIRGYKAAVTKRINQLYDIQNIRIWQRNYFEHIIRNPQSYEHISDYIKTNPQNWIYDNYNNNK